jgi:cobalt-zinc-cadmium efflux system outer membrane protein
MTRAVLAAALLPAGAGAQTVSLTEAQALARLSSESPRVQAALAAVDVARADVLAAGRWPNPTVVYNREAVSGVTEHITTVSQVLPITGRRSFGVNAASALVDASGRRADERVWRLRADLRLAFTDLATAQVREAELARSRDRLSTLAQVLARRESEGDAAGFDRLRAEREVIDVEADRASVAAERARAQAVLASFFPGPLEGTAIVVEPTARTPAPLPSVEELMARAERTHGELLALGHELDAAVWHERAAARRLWPEPEVVAGTKSSNALGGDVGSLVSVHITVPLFDRSQPERAAAQARAGQARAEADALRQTLRAQIVAWRAAVVERRDIAARYRTAVAAGADEIARIAQVSYEAGEQGILELLDAHRIAAAARLRQATLDADVREAEIELEYVSGWEIP